jgi:energy-coupling factor transport system ATP-binding protein
MIELREAAFYYPDRRGSPRQVFQRFNLRIPQGRYVAIMGPNGAGKSTLGKMIKGLLPPSSGQVIIGGESLRPGEVSPRVGYVFSNPENQIIASVVEEDVAFALENRGMNPSLISQRVRDSLRWVNMENYRFYPPHLLSGGQQQKVVLAGVVAMKSEILVLDEPTSMLDLQDRNEMLDLFAKIHDQGATLVHITHSFEEALHAQDFLYLDNGCISFYGTWHSFFDKGLSDLSFKIALPPILELVQKLRERGHGIPNDVCSLDQLKDFLRCPPQS